MSNEGQSELSRHIQKPAHTARRKNRIASKIEDTPYEPIASPVRAATPTSALKQRPKVEHKEASPTSSQVDMTAVFEERAAKAKHEETEAENKKVEGMTAKKSSKGKKPSQSSQGKAKVEKGPKEAERVNTSISPAKSAPKTKENAGRFSEEVKEFIRRRKLELAESEDKDLTQDSRKSEQRQSLKKEKEKEKKEPQPRLTPGRSKPSRQATPIKEREKEVRGEKEEEKELLERVENMEFKEVLEVDVREDGILVYLAAFLSEQKDDLKVVEFQEQELARLGKMWGTELRYDFLKDYLVAACPKK